MPRTSNAVAPAADKISGETTLSSIPVLYN